MTRSSARRAFFFVMSMTLPVVLLGCPKKPVPVEDAGEPAPAPTPSVTQLAALTDDGGDDASEAAAPKHWTGPAVNPNQMKIKACCNAMRATHDPTLMAVASS